MKISTGWVPTPAIHAPVPGLAKRARNVQVTHIGVAGGRGSTTRRVCAQHVILAAKKRRGKGKTKEVEPGEEKEIEDGSDEAVEPKKFKPRGLTMSKQVDEYGFLRPDYSSNSSLPDVVADRMGKRMLVLFSVPFFTGMGGFVTVYILSIKSDIVVLPSLVATSTLGTFGLALAGVTYGIMSASWDPEVEGSFWGFKEFGMNLTRTIEALTTQKKREDAQSRKD